MFPFFIPYGDFFIIGKKVNLNVYFLFETVKTPNDSHKSKERKAMKKK